MAPGQFSMPSTISSNAILADPFRQPRHRLLVAMVIIERREAAHARPAGVAHSPNVQSHFVSMARFWGTLAASGPSSDAGSKLSKAEMQTA
jgi:hypothetical protein